MTEMTRKRILVVDDEQDAREFVKAVLEEEYEILTASDGDEGLKIAEENLPNLIILDVQMPKLGGFDVFSQMKKDKALCEIPVIMLTGIREKVGVDFSKEEMGDFFGKEPSAYLEKPINSCDLLATVHKCLGGGGCCCCGGS